MVPIANQIGACNQWRGLQMNNPQLPCGRRWFREPIPEIYDAARYLDAAVSAHLAGESKIASELIKLADMPILRAWLDPIWGANNPHLHYRPVGGSPALVPKEARASERMPDSSIKRRLIERDGYHCRLCSIPLVRGEVHGQSHALYPDALPWAAGNINQHAAFQVLWLQYDHLVPHARGGSNELDNMLIKKRCQGQFTASCQRTRIISDAIVPRADTTAVDARCQPLPPAS